MAPRGLCLRSASRRGRSHSGVWLAGARLDFRRSSVIVKAPRFIAKFDSSAAMLQAIAHFLHGRDFPALGQRPTFAYKLLARSLNLLPERPREFVYSTFGALEGVVAHKLSDVREEVLAEWMVDLYPKRTYPAVMMGSSSGAAVHLCAALGIPWFAQTFLIPVRRTEIHPDEMRAACDWGAAHADGLLKANPDLQLHHMHDPNQDRLMIRCMSYFRVKRRRLGPAMETFLAQHLAPGGTIFLLDCTRRWPAVQVGERHLFQPGATGGIAAEEYMEGSPRVAEFLERYDSHRRAWDPPAPDGEYPEAEWGFEPALGDDVARFAAERGFRVRRLAFEEPDDLSPLTADLYRWWYRRRGLPDTRLLVESFILMDPWWTLRTGSVPFWMKFNVSDSADALEHYLDAAGPFDEIHMMLFSHGTESAGLAPIDRWQALLRRARRQGRLVGVDAEKYPKDFGSFARYHTEVQRIPDRVPMPEPLSLEALDAFFAEVGDRYTVDCSDVPTP